MNKKLKKLQTTLQSYERVLIAFSGGVDSAFLLKVALDSLSKKNVYALTCVSEFLPQRELMDAKRLARQLGAPLTLIKKTVLRNKTLLVNPRDRCYHCKRALLIECNRLAKKMKCNAVCDAANVDDLTVYRPGNKAAKELKIKRPLIACGFTKKDIRCFSRKLGLPTWNKPSYSCLATRFSYGEKLTTKKLLLVDQGEETLRRLGLQVLRLRYSGGDARLEVGEREMRLFSKKDFRDQCVYKLKRIGFKNVSLDLEGYRSGSMDEGEL